MNSSNKETIDVNLLLSQSGIKAKLFLDDMEILLASDEVGNTLEESVKVNYDYLQRIDVLLQVELFIVILSKLTNRYVVEGLDVTVNTDAESMEDLLKINGIRIELLLDYLREKTRADSVANVMSSRLRTELELFILLLTLNNKTIQL